MSGPLKIAGGRSLVFLAALLLWLFDLTTALAGLSDPRSYATLSADGKRILVMLSAAKVYDRKHPTDFSLPGGRSIIVHETFPKSGVYDSATLLPVWQCDWYAFRGDLRCADDFTDVARFNRFGLTSDWALAFYHEGRLVRSYDCRYLLTGFRCWVFLPFETWDWHYAWDDSFERAGNHIVLSTARRRLYFFGHELNLGLKEHYIFDLGTGCVLARDITDAWRIWLFLVVLPVAMALTICGLVLRRIKKPQG